MQQSSRSFSSIGGPRSRVSQLTFALALLFVLGLIAWEFRVNNSNSSSNSSSIRTSSSSSISSSTSFPKLLHSTADGSPSESEDKENDANLTGSGTGTHELLRQDVSLGSGSEGGSSSLLPGLLPASSRGGSGNAKVSSLITMAMGLCLANNSEVPWVVVTPPSQVTVHGKSDTGSLMPPPTPSESLAQLNLLPSNSRASERELERELERRYRLEVGIPNLRRALERILTRPHCVARGTWDTTFPYAPITNSTAGGVSDDEDDDNGKSSGGGSSSLPLAFDDDDKRQSQGQGVTLALPKRMVRFSEFTTPGTWATPPSEACAPGTQFPYVDAAGFASLADSVFLFDHEEERALKSFHTRMGKLNYVSKYSRPTNRSLVYFSLCRYRGTKRLLDFLKARPDLYFFLMVHVPFCNILPLWVIHHPQVLKVFAVNFQLLRIPCYRHAKVLGLPMGIPRRHAKVLYHVAKTYLSVPLPPPPPFVVSPLRRTRNASSSSSSSVEDGEGGGSRHEGEGDHQRWLFAQGFGTKRYGNPKKSRILILQQVKRVFHLTSDITDRRGKGVDAYIYLGNMTQYRYVFAPPGSAVDTYRVWEALYLGKIPITLAALVPYVYEGLPVLLRPRLSHLHPEELARAWLNLTVAYHYNIAKLSMLWWIKRILHECLSVP